MSSYNEDLHVVKEGVCDACGKKGTVVRIGRFWICGSNLCYKMLIKFRRGDVYNHGERL